MENSNKTLAVQFTYKVEMDSNIIPLLLEKGFVHVPGHSRYDSGHYTKQYKEVGDADYKDIMSVRNLPLSATHPENYGIVYIVVTLIKEHSIEPNIVCNTASLKR